jgi:transcriptional regulator with XRE-family HTH domain
MDPNTTLTGPQIVYIRNRLGFRSQAALAKRIGSSQAALSRKETNLEPQKGPEIILIVLLAKEAKIEIVSTEEAVAFLEEKAEFPVEETAA